MTTPQYGDCYGCGQPRRLTARGLVYRHGKPGDTWQNCSGSGRPPITPVAPDRVQGATTVHLPDTTPGETR